LSIKKTIKKNKKKYVADSDFYILLSKHQICYDEITPNRVARLKHIPSGNSKIFSIEHIKNKDNICIYNLKILLQSL
ncbi:MAG: hypothetical protein RL736_603, partial [Pseudomonadota bacterium]|jgi:hypothetical protein